MSAPRRFRRWPSLWGPLVGGAVVVIVALPTVRRWFVAPPTSQPEVLVSPVGANVLLAGGPCEIVRVVDGRTLVVRQPATNSKQPAENRFQVRLLGVEDPAPHAAEALAALTQLAPPGPAFIELDKRRAADDGSWLAHLYVQQRLLAGQLLRAGWGRYQPYSGDSFDAARLLREAESEARRARRGMWREES
jgi:endonuclease YncB( thermonuclease family)